MSDHPIRPIAVADPHAEFLTQATEIRAAINRVLDSGHYILGPEVSAFETEFADYIGVPNAYGVANGTEALELGLRAVGVKPGDKVATVAHTVTATATAIVEIGAEPLFVDIDPATMVMDCDALESILTSHQIKAVVPVHLYGQPVDMPRLITLAHAHQAKVVEDCAQSCGAQISGKKTGAWGDAAAFSFYPTKNLGAIGDGGAITTSDNSIAQQIRDLRQYGWRQRYVSSGPGRNSRLDEMQAAILRTRLPLLDTRNSVRRSHAQRYQDALENSGLCLPIFSPEDDAVFHQYTIRTPSRDELRDYLSNLGIGTGLLYSTPLHHQPAFSSQQQLPQTEQAARELLNLPVHPCLTSGDIDRVITAIQSFSA